MDAHVHVMTRQLLQGLDIGQRYSDGHIDLQRAREGGIDAMFFSIYTPEAYYPGRHEVTNTFRVAELALEQIEKNSDLIELALSASDIERINSQGKMAAFLDLEGGWDLDGDLGLLRALYRLGLRSVQLTAHDYTNGFADTCCDESRWGGVNAHGRAVVAEMNRLGMVINLAHASDETILQTAELSIDPVIYSHSGFRHFVDISRCTSDEAAKAIAANGGVIALAFGSINNPKYYQWKFPGDPQAAEDSQNVDHSTLQRFADMSLQEIDREVAKDLPYVFGENVPDPYRMSTDDLVGVIDYAVGLVGEDHVALGSDFDGNVSLTLEMKDASDYGEITKGLQRLNYSEERIRKILGLNLLRVIRQVTE